MSHASTNPEVLQYRSALGTGKLSLAIAAMVLGNLALPYAVHQIPDAGRILLPIFFFTLVAGWRFGAQAGVLTGLLSPLANHFLTGMPPGPMLQDIMLQSALLGAMASLLSSRRPRPTLPLLALLVLAHQALVLLPLLIHAGFQPCLAMARLRVPGMLLQILGGFAVLRLMARYLPGAQDAGREG